MDSATLLIALGALVVVILGSALGFFIGRARSTTALNAAREQRSAAETQVGALREELDRARREATARVDEERRRGAAHAAEVAAAAETVLAATKSEANQRLDDERSQSVARLQEMVNDHQRQMGEAERKSQVLLEEERVRSESALAGVRAEGGVTAARLAGDRETREKELLARIAEEKAAATAGVEAERARATEQLEEIRADHKRLADEFAALSKTALENNTRQFLDQAEERLKRSQGEAAAELQKRQDAVEKLVEPISTTLATVQSEVVSAEKARAEASAALTQQLTTMQQTSVTLSEETRNLVNALRAPQVRGRWGEQQLRRVVEVAGMLNHVDFAEQVHHATDDGAMRPDLIVNLAGDKRVVVDSKVAFNGYLEAMEAKDDQLRNARLVSHSRQLKKHIDDLAAKAYWDGVSGSPEFVVLFVPAEPFLAAALEQDPTLFEHAFSKNVVIATPSTLVALLRTVGHVWRQDQIAREAQQIFEVGKELHKRLGIMGAHLTNIGKRLNATVDAYNKTVGSLDRNVVTSARRFSGLQGLPDVLDALLPVEALANPPQKKDLYSEAEGTHELIATAEEKALEA